jgi:dTDP-glucose pyrophosphorylase
MNIVILAAGQGKRMRSSLPKVLHPIAGRPMLAHVIDTARVVSKYQPNPRIVVVVGHGAESVRAVFEAERDVNFVLQEPQLGTGHAVMQALPHLADDTHTLVPDFPTYFGRRSSRSRRSRRSRRIISRSTNGTWWSTPARTWTRRSTSRRRARAPTSSTCRCWSSRSSSST